MRQRRVFVVAMMATVVLTASLLKCVSCGRRPRAVPALRPLDAGSAIDASVSRDVRVGPPPADAAAGTRGAPMLHGDVRHTDRAYALAPRFPVVAWEHDVGGPVEAQVTTSSDEQTLYVASLGGSLTALAANDGTPRWTLDLGDRAYSTPCVADDGTIFVGSDAMKLTAVSSTGKVKWTLDTDGEADTAPAIAPDGSVVFAAGRNVYAVSERGSVKWRFSAKRKVFSAPAIAPGGRVIVGSQDHRVYAISTDGRALWSTDLGADVDASPAVADDGAVYCGDDGDEVVRLDPDDGHVVWRSSVGGYVRGALSMARDGDVLAGVYGPTPRFVRLRASDGAIVVAVSVPGTGARDFGVHGAPVEDSSGMLLFGAQDDQLRAIDPNGNILWSFTTKGDVDAPVTLLSDGTVVLASDDGVVRALRARIGDAENGAAR